MSEDMWFLLFAGAITLGVVMLVWPAGRAVHDEDKDMPRAESTTMVARSFAMGVPMLAVLIYLAVGTPALLQSPEEEAALSYPGVPLASATRERVAARWRIEGEVTIAPQLLSSAPAGAILLVYAKAVDGNPMPLAVYKMPVTQWPTGFVLDDNNAMLPDRALQDHAVVDLYARISATGQAKAAPGDLEGKVEAVKIGEAPVRITINHRH